jgi:DNA-binding NarL/FixJ family response regulator
MQQYEMPSETAGLHKLLYEAYKKKGAFEKALQAHELYTMITDSISNLETKKTILELEKKYNREQDAREIAVLKQSVLQEEARNRYYIIAALVALIVLLMVLVLFYLRRRSARFREELARKENEKLKATNDLRNKELVSKALQIANMNETVSNISDKIKEVTPSLNKMQREAIIAAIREFELSVPEQAWAEFETRFEQVHEDFYNQLKVDFPQLSPTEIKICSFLRLNLSTKEISALTNRGVGTIDNARSSIRRKLNLGQDDNLTTFLLNL